jgi:nucleoside-diphosphate-sugar epimerase
MTEALVIGGAGYIGSVLVPALLEGGYRVKVLDNFLFHQISLVECCAYENFSVVRGDYRDADTLREAMRTADYIIPLAAIVGAPACQANASAAVSTNLDGVRQMLGLRSRDQRVISPCTNSGYGVGEKNRFCTEETPLRPISLYGRTKIDAEKAILDAGGGISLRLATVFGVSPRPRLDLLVNDFVHRAFHDGCLVVFEGHFKRNYLHVRDVARAFLHAMDQFESMRDNVYNVGLSDANLSKLELCALIKQQLPGFVYTEAPVGRDPDQRDYIVSNEKIERTGFRPAYSLETGIGELIKACMILPARQHANG